MLRLKHGKWYVGKSTSVLSRYQQHLSGQGPLWTRIHRPIKLMRVREAKTLYDEDNTFKDLVFTYGLENVRGGSHSSVKLDSDTKLFIQKEIYTSRDLCFTCGGKGHLADRCDARTNISGDDHGYRSGDHCDDTSESTAYDDEEPVDECTSTTSNSEDLSDPEPYVGCCRGRPVTVVTTVVV